MMRHGLRTFCFALTNAVGEHRGEEQLSLVVGLLRDEALSRDSLRDLADALQRTLRRWRRKGPVIFALVKSLRSPRSFWSLLGDEAVAEVNDDSCLRAGSNPQSLPSEVLGQDVFFQDNPGCVSRCNQAAAAVADHGELVRSSSTSRERSLSPHVGGG